MKNITVSVDEKTHRLACVRAAELDTSVEALVREYLSGLAYGRLAPNKVTTQSTETDRERRKRLMDEVWEDIRATRPWFTASDNLPREALHEERSEVR